MLYTTGADAHLDRNGLEILDMDECLTLLGRSGIGRIALEATGRPRIFPVNYALIGRDIVFRTAPGTKLADAARECFVAFEVDEFDMFEHTGWSVLVSGVARHVSDPDDLARFQRLQLRPWGPGHKDHFVRITPVQITGRRINRIVPRDEA